MNETKKSSDRENKLIRHGWTRQFVASEPRLSEAVELYQTTGYEVHLEPLTKSEAIDLENTGGCTACFDGFEDQYRVIYTRPKKEREDPEDDLW